MGAVRSLVVLTAGAAIGAAAVIAHRIMQDTGKPLQEALTEVPAEIEKVCAELKAKVLDAVSAGWIGDEDAKRDGAHNLSESGAGQE